MAARSPTRSLAFTLIELLVVIAIISLLGAILFPVFAQARAKARQAACLSNLHQIGLALALYQDDNDERLMPGHLLSTTDPNGQTQYGGWAGPCNVYARAPQVFVCPTDDTKATMISGETAFPITYFFNLNLGGGYAPDGLPRSAFTAPAATVVLTESTLGYSRQTARLQNPNETESSLANYFYAADPAHNRHQGGRIFLLADGHARWLRPEAVTTGNPTQAAPPDKLPPGIIATFNYQ